MKSFEELFNEFNNNEKIKKIREELLIERKAKNKKMLKTFLVVDIIVILLLSLILKFSITTFMVYITSLVLIDIIILVVFSLSGGKKQDEFIDVFKEQVIKSMIQNFYSDMEYFPNLKLPEKFYEEGKFNEKYDEYNSDDNIRAKIQDKYYINIGEVETQIKKDYEDAEGNSTVYYQTVFCGLFARICLEKDINTDLRITNKKAEYSNKLEMDSSDFEKAFNVYTSDKIKGMQILTSDIMEEILNYKYRSNFDFDIYIENNKIYFRFQCGNVFEPKNIEKGELDEKSLRLYYDILKFTYELTNKLIKVINEVEI